MLDQKDQNNLIQVIVALCFLVLFLFFVNIASASADTYLMYHDTTSEYITYVSDIDENALYYENLGVYYLDTPATTTGITNLGLRLGATGNDLGDYIIIRFCSGPYDITASINDNLKCQGNAQTMWNTQNVVVSSIDWNTGNFTEFDLLAFEYPDRANNFFTLQVESIDEEETSLKIVMEIADNYPYGYFNRNGLWTGFDLSFYLNHNEEYTGPETMPEGSNWTYDIYNYLEDVPDYHTALNTVCLTDEPCNIYYYYNKEAIGKTLYFIADNGQQIKTANASTSKTIIAQTINEDYMTLPARTSAGTEKFCLYLVDPVFGDVQKCGYGLEWVAGSDYMPDFPFLTDPCESVATSSGSVLDDMRYSVECGLKQVVYWAFVPDDTAINSFIKGVRRLENAFPFNTLFTFTNIANEAIAQADSASSTLGIPFIDNEGNYYILPVLSSSSMPDLIGQENTNAFRLGLGYFIWVFVIMIIVLTIHHHLNKQI